MEKIITKAFLIICCLSSFSLQIARASDPTSSAPTPTQPAANVISLFSNAYSNVTVDTWSAVWDAADLSNYVIGTSDSVKKYSNLQYCGIEFTSQTIDATNMTHFHTDLWTPDASIFRIKLVDFGADGAYGGGDDTEQELTFDATTSPAVTTNSWISFDIPLSLFAGMTSRQHVAQLLYVSESNTAFIDNVYFHSGGTSAPEPTSSAPAPTAIQSDVISLFSNAYNNVTVDTWSASWDAADLSNYVIGTNDSVKKYSSLVFCGIEFTSQTIDATNMSYFHTDIWTPDATTFGMKLVDFGADGVFGGGDDTEQQLDFNATTSPAIVTGSWISFDIPLSQFTGLASRSHLAQLIYVAGGSTVYVDNVYFHKLSTGIQDIQPVSNLFSAYPTVADAGINIQMNNISSAKKTTLTMSNMLGQVVYNGTIELQLTTIPVHAMPAGLYQVTILSGNQIQSQKVIVRH
ncbi:MAG: T9SS type A sorting domain-containing protein [Chitinophagales bacterium]|nr:T9SS type A sorting domain-containing protein [Chitinophagales bacterium]